MIHWIKYIPAVLFALAALFFLILTRAGDNSDADALAGFFYLPAIACAVLAAIAGLIAWVF